MPGCEPRCIPGQNIGHHHEMNFLSSGAVRRNSLSPVDQTDKLRLLKKAFSDEEWNYLNQNKVFQDLLGAGDSRDYENLMEAGSLLLRQRKELR